LREQCSARALPISSTSSLVVSYLLKPPRAGRICRLPATRDAASRRTCVSVVTTDAWAYAVVGRQVRRKGHLISAGSRNPGGLLWGVPTVCVNTSRANPWLEKVRAGRLTRRLIAARGTRVHRMRHPSYRPRAEERLNARLSNFPRRLNATFTLSLLATKSGEAVPFLSVVRPADGGAACRLV